MVYQTKNVMKALGFILGLYGYTIFLLGLLGLLYPPILLIHSLLFLFILWKSKKKIITKPLTFFHSNKFLLIIFILLALINVMGALGPEIGFDALWYHLTLPQLYLKSHRLLFIKDPLLHYSAMPQLGEMFYIPALAFGNEIVAKVIHFLFGLFCGLALYNLALMYMNKKMALLITILFYSNLVVSWESITAYIDLIRTFFEILALSSFLNWWDSKKELPLLQSGLFIGFAISVKLLGFGTLAIFLILLIYKLIQNRYPIKTIIWHMAVLVVSTLVFPMLWLIRTFLLTGNPFFPFFSEQYSVHFSWSLFSPIVILKTIWGMFTHLDDPISPVYLIVIPLLVTYYKTFQKKYTPILYYCILAITIWYITPQTGGGRFILPYLPAFSLLVGIVIIETKDRFLKNSLVYIIAFLSVVTFGYRTVANSKFIPVIIGKETKSEFLAKHLAFSLGDFYDTDGYFKKYMSPQDTVLLYGFHNLYYLDFPYVHSAWIKKGERFNYIATQNTPIPQRFSEWQLLYSNPTTHVNLYSRGGRWETF